MTIPCHNTRKTIQKAVLHMGRDGLRVKPYNVDKDTPAAARQAAHPWPPTAAEQRHLAAVTQLQLGVAAATAAAGSSGIGLPAARSRLRSSTSSSGVGSKRRRARFSVSRASAATAAAVSVAEQPQAVQQQQQQQQVVSLQQPPSVLQQVSSSSSGQQRLLQLPPVPVPPPQYSNTDEPLPTALIEVLLHKPTIRAPHQFEDGYIWQDIVMVSRHVGVFGGGGQGGDACLGRTGHLAAQTLFHALLLSRDTSSNTAFSALLTCVVTATHCRVGSSHDKAFAWPGC